MPYYKIRHQQEDERFIVFLARIHPMKRHGIFFFLLPSQLIHSLQNWALLLLQGTWLIMAAILCWFVILCWSQLNIALLGKYLFLLSHFGTHNWSHRIHRFSHQHQSLTGHVSLGSSSRILCSKSPRLYSGSSVRFCL